jgi:cell division protein FtsZ
MVNKVEPIAIPKQENIVEWDMPTVVTSNNEAEQPEELVMELIIKEEKVAPVISIMVEEPIVNSEVAMQENVLASATNEQQEVEEDSLTKAAERTKKLRNLSFNFDSAEADTFENEPAYLRRKNEIHNTLANVEKFYSNYTVSVDDNNEAKINTNSKNSFLEGEKPD